ncbi:uncharacterized protein CDV56_103207 [Aspergillus thermomutatus]|uniref:AMP-dependent synthetase/ligase domain-containing protein n=1 Tax=Aspergillus thermomutatus TaxID=41047 RepID=A0A397G5L8_ASPTH|nr:uncharacterized protein CDV56_103207 [Aspergillus thermomutatus]RHZ44878.1 hypothetical protein CDV56_103207 [Aspergillus thermomutatus]
MAPERYSLADVLSIARIHPFYCEDVQYPPNADAIQAALEQSTKETATSDLLTQPLLEKKSIYKAVERLVKDASPENTYRQSSYMSITGGGGGGVPMLFAVDVHENRQQRMQMGKFLRLCRVIDPRDWVLSIHVAGGFYRSLDLTTEIMENAGATVLSGGNNMTLQEIIQALVHYRVNVLTGDGSQVVQVIHHISTLPPVERAGITLNKIIYTSEPLTRPQRDLVRATLPGVAIYSVMGSSEAGPWAISNPHLTGEETLVTDSSGTADFVFDTRNMHIEILPQTLLTEGGSLGSLHSHPLPLGEPGIIVQTSLQRLRNPLVRYITGDIGSLHPLPEPASALIPACERQYLRVLRMQGRDRRFSFKWDGYYIEFENLKALMQAEGYGILQWQVILDQLEDSLQRTLEVRLLQAPSGERGIIAREELIKRVRDFFLVLPENEGLFRLVFVDDLDGFERSSTAGKVIHFIDRQH